ncbi:hypothetical protein OS175_02655 [Marinicella sp. S1101]|uniref:CAP domain-containing protein n=1 Tax=Marinicella marina TaxID=2996016 RepID=UPI002260BB12|nr:CAP domain-containing protein [Marinicella marina]MCX7552767.1 hypothetical protein [Marinicella marina]MDJ1139924.1 hypothetical protein [Marinicella marina]
MTELIKKLLLLLMMTSSNPVFSQAEAPLLNSCGIHPKAAHLAQLIIQHDEQQRFHLACHPTLALTAAKKAKAMASNQRIEHNLDYSAPNALLESHGYFLPAAFLPTSNQVESIAGGSKTAEKTLYNLKNSKNHRSHMLGLTDFHQGQIHIGVGYHYNPDTPHEHHWVVHIAEPRRNLVAKQSIDYQQIINDFPSKHKAPTRK